GAGDFGSGVEAVLVPVGGDSLALAAVLLDGGALAAAAPDPGSVDVDPSLVVAVAQQPAALPPADAEVREEPGEEGTGGERTDETPGERALRLVAHAGDRHEKGEDDKPEEGARPELTEEPLGVSRYVGGFEEAERALGWGEGEEKQKERDRK